MCYKDYGRPDKNRKPRHLELKQKFNDIFEDWKELYINVPARSSNNTKGMKNNDERYNSLNTN